MYNTAPIPRLYFVNQDILSRKKDLQIRGLRDKFTDSRNPRYYMTHKRT